jgi:hypothetical protein
MDAVPKPRVLNKKHGGIPKDAIYCGRPSIFGNPFVIGRDGTRAQVIEKYEAWLLAQPDLVAQMPSLTGHHLVCWCAPLPCHCAPLQLRLANPTIVGCK